ncbi:hypothetical protein V8E53_012227 [Lactarius tabidus]
MFAPRAVAVSTYMQRSSGGNKKAQEETSWYQIVLDGRKVPAYLVSLVGFTVLGLGTNKYSTGPLISKPRATKSANEVSIERNESKRDVGIWGRAANATLEPQLSQQLSVLASERKGERGRVFTRNDPENTDSR